MHLDFSSYNQDLVKLVCSAIFNDGVARFQDLKDLVWNKTHNEADEDKVVYIVQILIENGYISNITPIMPMTSQTTNKDFMITGKDKTQLKNQDLI